MKRDMDRREFLKLSGVFGAIAGLPGSIGALTDNIGLSENSSGKDSLADWTNIEKYAGDESTYPTRIQNQIDWYKTIYPEVAGAEVVEGDLIERASDQSIVVLNFSKDITANPWSVARMFDFTMQLARSGQAGEYEGIRYKLNARKQLDATIGLIPSQLAVCKSYTQISFAETPHLPYISLWDNTRLAPQDVYPSATDVSTNDLFTEIIQSTIDVRVDADQSGLSNRTIAQEIFANSLGLAIYLKQKSLPYQKYQSLMLGGRVNFNLDINGLKKPIVFGSGFYESIPVFRPILRDNN